MLLFQPKRASARCLSIVFLISTTTAAGAHEAWLLTPDEIARLAVQPIPAIFASKIILMAAAFAATAMTVAALLAEDWIRPIEDQFAPPLYHAARLCGPVLLRVGLAAMLLLAATGGLPRHGTDIWTTPTLFVPDMQLTLVPGWAWLQQAQIAIAITLILGFGTQLACLGVIGLSLLGPILFGFAFWSYTPHFIAPALMLMILGAGQISVDRLRGCDQPDHTAIATPLWRLATILIGVGFIYLAVAHKLLQPTLLIAILEHGAVPTFGLPITVVALIMTGVEIVCGALLVMGRLIRPVAITIIGAITFLAITLGETPLFHANLYAAMAVIAMIGARWPQSDALQPNRKGALA